MRRVLSVVWYLSWSVVGALFFTWVVQIIGLVTPLGEQRFDPLVVLFVTLLFFGWFPQAIFFFLLVALITTRMTSSAFPEAVFIYTALYACVQYLLTHVMTHRTLWSLIGVTLCATVIQRTIHAALLYVVPSFDTRVTVSGARDIFLTLVIHSGVVFFLFMIHRRYARQ